MKWKILVSEDMVSLWERVAGFQVLVWRKTARLGSVKDGSETEEDLRPATAD